MNFKMERHRRIYEINNSVFSIILGDIIESEAEVIISSDDNYISMGGGVSASIKVGAGDYIIKDTQKHVPCGLGDVIVSSAGSLKQKYVFHCITLLNNRGKRIRPRDVDTQRQIISNCIEKCFRLLPLLGVSSIAFSPIGSRVAKYPLDDIASLFSETVARFCYNTNKKYEIELYLQNNAFGFDIMDYIVFFEAVSTQIGIINKQYNNQTIRDIISPQNISFEQEKDGDDLRKHIFISYSRVNKDKVRPFCKILEELKISYWIDIEGNYSGKNFKEEIVDAIESSSLILFFSSKESNESNNVVKEISMSVSLNKHILPIKLDDSQYAKSIRFDLSDIDWIEYDGSEKSMKKFINCIKLFISEI